MAKLGTHKHPAVVRLNTIEKAEAIVKLCSEHGWQVIAGVEDGPEDTSDVDRLLKRESGAAKADSKPRQPPKISPNDYCPCRSGKKFKNCCGAAGSPS